MLGPPITTVSALESTVILTAGPYVVSAGTRLERDIMVFPLLKRVWIRRRERKRGIKKKKERNRRGP